MAETERTVSLNVIARMDQYARDIKARLPNITEKAAELSARKLAMVEMKAEMQRRKAFEDSVKKRAKFYQQAMSTAAGLVTVEFAKASVDFFRNLGQHLADTRNALGDMSAATGQSVKSLQVLGFAAETSGGDFSELNDALKGVPKKMLDFARGAGEAAPALRALGFSQAEVTAALREGRDILPDVIDRLQSVRSVQMKAALAASIFGEKGTRLIQVLGDKTFKQWVELTERYALDVGPKAIEKAQKWEAASAMLAGKWVIFKDALFEALGGLDGFVRAAAVTVAGLSLMADALRFVSKMWEVMAESAAAATIALVAAVQGDLAKAEKALQYYVANASSDLGEMGRTFLESFGKAGDAYSDFIKDVDAFTRANERAAGSIGNLNKALSEQELADLEAKIQGVMQASSQFMVSSWHFARNGIRLANKEIERDWVKTLDAGLKAGVITQEQYSRMRLRIEEHTNKKIREETRKLLADRVSSFLGSFDQIAQAAQGLADTLYQIQVDRHMREGEEHQEHLENSQERRKSYLEKAQELEMSWREAEIRGNMTARQMADRQRDLDRANHLRNMAEKAKATQAMHKVEAKEAKTALRKSAKSQKRWTIFSLVLNGLVAAGRAFAELGPIGGAIAAAAIGLSTAGAVAAAKARPLPSFFRGGGRRGSQGEYAAMLHEGEQVLTSRAVRQIGGPEIVDAINAGFGGVQMGAPRVVLDGEEISRRVAARLRRPGDLREAVTEATMTGRRSPYGY